MINTGLPRHPKLFALASAAHVGWPAALGHLVALWCDVMVQREGGVLEGWARGDLERVAGWKGKRGVFVAALEQTGWIETLEDGHLKVHDWEEHQGNIIEDRRLEAKRKRIERAHKKGKHCEDCSDVCRTSSGRPSDVTRMSGAPIPSSPFPSHPSQEEDQASADAAPPPPQEPWEEPKQESEVTWARIVDAYRRWDPTVPIRKCESEIQRAVRLGISLSRLLEDVERLS